MQPITRINANDPVIFSEMNLRFNEIEARDNEQQEQINVLSANTFMKATCQQYYKGVYITDWNNVIENGLYMASPALNSPMGDNSAWWIVEVKAHNALYCVQDAYGFTDLKCKRFTRTMYNGTWSEWIPINEIHSAITFFNGWSQFSGHQHCQVGRIGNRCFLSGLATKGTVTGGTNVLQVPEYFYPKTTPDVLVNGEYGFYMGTNGVLTLNWIRDATIDSSHPWYSLDGLSWEVE